MGRGCESAYERASIPGASRQRFGLMNQNPKLSGGARRDFIKTGREDGKGDLEPQVGGIQVDSEESRCGDFT